MESRSVESVFEIKNIRLFIAFRMFFNARFYYPVYTILFLDFGLTIQQFALLNVVWAATIVLLEVPSGALADIIGRKKLLVIAGILMVAEIALLCFAPRKNSDLLFGFFFMNRILSGTAEAAASGADEALAYDSLKQNGRSDEWGLILEKQIRFQSIAFIFAMSVGALVYDLSLMQKIVNLLNLNIAVTQEVTLRLPLFLTLLMAILTLITAFRMQETDEAQSRECSALESCRNSVVSALKLTLQTGSWIVKTPVAFVLISAGMIFDHVIRMFITLSSQYYRLISLPEASFGLIGSGLAILGFIIPRLARLMVQKQKPLWNFTILSCLTLLGLIGITLFLPLIGLIPVVLLIAAMYLSSFFLSHYLNQITDSSQRATVLSFKGLFYNLAYGIIGVLYSLLLTFLHGQISLEQFAGEINDLENEVFIESIGWFPWYFILMFIILALLSKRWLHDSRGARGGKGFIS